MELMEPPSAMGTPPQLEKSIFENRWALSQIQYQYVPYANHGAGIFTYICLGDLSWANVGIHIPAPWSIWLWEITMFHRYLHYFDWAIFNS